MTVKSAAQRGEDVGAWRPSSAMRVMVERSIVAFECTPDEFFGPRRIEHFVRARMAAVWLLRQHWKLSWTCTARAIGRTSPASARYLGGEALVWRRRDERFREVTDALLIGAPIPKPQLPGFMPLAMSRAAPLAQRVKPKNRMADDDHDARARFRGTRALAHAIEASGGRFT